MNPNKLETKSNKQKPKRGRPVGDRESKRIELLDAVVEQLTENGSHGVSFRKVAAKVGCTTGTMTYYFENKEAMLVAVTDYLFNEFEKILEGEQGNVKAVLDKWLKWSHSESSNIAPIVAELLVYARQEPSYAKHLQQRYVKLRSLLTETLKQGQLLGQVRNDIDAALLADQLSALVDGWMIISPIETERFEPKQTKAFFDATLRLFAP